MDRRDFIRALGASGAAAALPSSAADPALPKGPVRIVVGFSAGGGTDVLARIFATKLAGMWGVPVLVDNRVGAAGVIAAVEVAKAAPDGNTLMMGHINSLGLAPGLNPKLSYSPERDFSPLVLVGKTPQVLVAHPGQPAKGVAALVEHCKANPGKVAFGSAGAGSAQHLSIALFEQRAGVEVLHIPYKGSAPLVTDLLGGHVHYAFDGMTTASPLIRDGKVSAVAQTGPRRSKAFPQVPTVAESGFPGFEASIWFGLVGPAGLPPALMKRMNADMNQVLAMPDVASRLADFGAEDGGGTPEHFAEFMRAEQAKWSRLIRERKITVET